jgi:hypothetical protein
VLALAQAVQLLPESRREVRLCEERTHPISARSKSGVQALILLLIGHAVLPPTQVSGPCIERKAEETHRITRTFATDRLRNGTTGVTHARQTKTLVIAYGFVHIGLAVVYLDAGITRNICWRVAIAVSATMSFPPSFACAQLTFFRVYDRRNAEAVLAGSQAGD